LATSFHTHDPLSPTTPQHPITSFFSYSLLLPQLPLHTYIIIHDALLAFQAEILKGKRITSTQEKHVREFRFQNQNEGGKNIDLH